MEIFILYLEYVPRIHLFCRMNFYWRSLIRFFYRMRVFRSDAWMKATSYSRAFWKNRCFFSSSWIIRLSPTAWITSVLRLSKNFRLGNFFRIWLSRERRARAKRRGGDPSNLTSKNPGHLGTFFLSLASTTVFAVRTYRSFADTLLNFWLRVSPHTCSS